MMKSWCWGSMFSEVPNFNVPKISIGPYCHLSGWLTWNNHPAWLRGGNPQNSKNVPVWMWGSPGFVLRFSEVLKIFKCILTLSHVFPRCPHQDGGSLHLQITKFLKKLWFVIILKTTTVPFLATRVPSELDVTTLSPGLSLNGQDR